MKLYKMEKGKKIAGICAGVADSFNMDVTLIRLIFIFATVLTGIWPGVVTYLAAWYLLPEKEKFEETQKNTEE